MRHFTETQPNYVYKTAKNLVNMYIESNAECVINISSGCRKRLLDAIDEAEEFPREYPLNENLFLEAEAEIFGLMRADSFARFKQSPLFKQAIEKLNCIPTNNNGGHRRNSTAGKFTTGVENNNNNIAPLSVSPSHNRSNSLHARKASSTLENPAITSNNEELLVPTPTHSNIPPRLGHQRNSSRGEVVVQFLKQRQASAKNLLAQEKEQEARKNSINREKEQAERARLIAATTPIDLQQQQQQQTINPIPNPNRRGSLNRTRQTSHHRSSSTAVLNSQHFFEATTTVGSSIPTTTTTTSIALAARATATGSHLPRSHSRSLDLLEITDF